MRMRLVGLVTGLALAVGVTACGSSSGPAAAPTTTVSSRQPSPQAKMICATEAVDDIAEALQIQTVQTPQPGWSGPDYTCTYAYPAGAHIVLSVRDLPSDAAAHAYLGLLGRKLKREEKEVSFGTQGAFSVADGSVAVQKDSHVLFVDVSDLPETWSQPPLSRRDAASIVATTIMGCWTGDG